MSNQQQQHKDFSPSISNQIELLLQEHDPERNMKQLPSLLLKYQSKEQQEKLLQKL